MNTKRLINYFGLIFFAFVLSGCQAVKDAKKPFKHNTPLIKENIKKDGRAEIQKTLELGPNHLMGKKFMVKEKKYLLKLKETIC